MLHRFLFLGWPTMRLGQPLWCALCLSILGATALGTPALAQADPMTEALVTQGLGRATESQPQPSDAAMMESPVQIDPLNSPHPVPWNWVLATQAEVTSSGAPSVRYYRSQSLMSPDGEYAAYSRIQMQVQPEGFRSRISSTMFLENVKTGDLRVITATSPLSDNPFLENEAADMPGAIAILIPVSWSPSGDRILAREFEGIFNTSDASDYAVVWDRTRDRTSTLAPTRIEYSNAILLGWSQRSPDQVLFRAGTLGDPNWPLWTVDTRGQTTLSPNDKPLVHGTVVNNVWAGPQAYR